ncbi:Protein of unknown function [Gryllus bimaculatus]|nr:Protein of unknown function [Gryllus bimaculatus]
MVCQAACQELAVPSLPSPPPPPPPPRAASAMLADGISSTWGPPPAHQTNEGSLSKESRCDWSRPNRV